MPENMEARLEAMKAAHRAERIVSLETRLDRLRRLQAALLEHEDALTKAANEDFSHRSAIETRLVEIDVTLFHLKSTQRNLKRWMATRRQPLPLPVRPARAELRPKPLGVVGIISPWNYPILLALSPLIGALAAGNRAMIKPSELSPRVSDVLANMLHGAFDEDEVRVFTGGPDIASAFSGLPFDHLLFTGSTSVGRKVYEAAAKNLTPVTLELGGKSPALILPSADLERAGRRIAWGKSVNAGQTCVAPDYVLVQRRKMEMLSDALMGGFAKLYPEGAPSADYTSMISTAHKTRQMAMLEEAKSRGCKTFTLESVQVGHKVAPSLVLDPPADLKLMEEEIFGPTLPVIPYDSLEGALEFIAMGEHPLAMYIFGEDKGEIETAVKGSLAGGICVNDTLLQAGLDSVPFGGVGASGIGAYHGKAGFDRFSHLEPIIYQSKWAGTALIEPPFKGMKLRLLKALRKFL
ncbi:coniferyl aldehyde dehydrogenase [Celeribacter litoreus]|uniref:coniferyl aldehyde dehydrogenase n=1 Tax=Celeribacter litoreus TaxID=2876714 RepID=UPI001CCB001B|nr:coniferyl aldehyde dehydrogenase [Celeribacter litoreus]MCA0044207.1 coniferyl aldehyde dehydrogenase [Celeribacter litoreus]